MTCRSPSARSPASVSSSKRRYKDQLDERGEQYIEFAVDGAKRMQALINDLLAFSRVGRNTGEFADIELPLLLAQAERQLSTMLDEVDGVVTSDPLPQVRGDASLLVQMLQNLIANGLKFRSEQAPRIHFAVAVSADDGFVELSCSDNGIGIEAQYRDKIFIIFQRLHSRDAYAGTGIGLSMCKKIVEFHGGRLWLDTSSPSDGSGSAGATFRFTLPLAQNEPRVDQPSAAAAPGARKGQDAR